MKLLSLLFACAGMSAAASFTISPGVHHLGATTANLNSTVTVTLSGSGSGSGFIYFLMNGELNVSLPPGVTGTCSGSPCRIFSTEGGSGAALFNAGSHNFPTASIPNAFATDAIFSTSPSGTNPEVSFDNASLFQYGGPGVFELGNKVYADTNGYIIGVRFNKPPTDSTSAHKVSLWDLAGNLLASADSSNETASGWQSVYFATPVSVAANTVYVASYYTSGPFWFNGNLLRNRIYGNGRIHASANYQEWNGSCNVNDAWPSDAAGRPAGGLIGCFQVSNGEISSIQNADAVTSSFATEGCQCMIGGIGPGPYKVQDNYISAVGLPWHHDEAGQNWATRADYTYFRNTFHTPFTRMYGHPQSDGLRYMHRQPLEWKSGQRISIVGNIFDGSWVEGNPVGTAIVLTSVAGQGITDVNVESNTFQHVSGIIGSPSIVEGGAPVTKPTSRFRFVNNLGYDINSTMSYWVNGGFAAPTGWISAGPNGSEDVVFDHNSMIGNLGRVPSVMHLFNTRTEGMQVTNNIFYFSGGNQGLTIDGGIIYPACAGGGKTLADCMFAGGYRWDHNLFLGDSSKSTIQSYWPSLNNYTPANPSDTNNVGWFSMAAANFRFKSSYCSGCGQPASDGKDVGTDIDVLEAAEGVVKLIGVPTSTITTSSASVAFVAPDSQACPVDYSASDPAVVTGFTRVADSGQARTRSVSLTGLSSGTVYYYRVNCAVQQPAGQFRTR